MGTNFYIKRTKPRMVYDEYHIAKTSWGWKPSFEAYTPYDWDDTDERPQVTCVSDIKHLVKNGEYEIVDEYGESYSWNQFDERVLKFGSEQNCKSHYNPYLDVYTDSEGFEFINQEFL